MVAGFNLTLKLGLARRDAVDSIKHASARFDGLQAKMAEPLQHVTITSDASAATTEKHAPSPPLESPRAIWTRRIIIFAFWAVVATLGLPHWIWTTSIYRSELPVEQMTKWSEGHVSI